MNNHRVEKGFSVRQSKHQADLMKSGMEIGGIPPLILLYKQATLFFKRVIGTVSPSANVSECIKSRSDVMIISILRIKEKSTDLEEGSREPGMLRASLVKTGSSTGQT